jgi:hypothetical protein
MTICETFPTPFLQNSNVKKSRSDRKQRMVQGRGLKHYYISWLFKRFNVTTMPPLTKRIFTLIKGMGQYERHVVLLVVFFNTSDHFDQMLNHTFNQKG